MRVGGTVVAPAHTISRLSLAAVLGCAALSGCGAGQDAQTGLARGVVDGINAQQGPVALRAAYIPFPPDGVYPVGATVPVLVTVLNQGTTPDRLVAVSSAAARSARLTQTGADPSAAPVQLTDLALPPQNSQRIGESGYALVLEGLTSELLPTGVVDVSFRFERAGEVTVPVVVQARPEARPERTPVAEEAGEEEPGGGTEGDQDDPAAGGDEGEPGLGSEGSEGD